MESVMPERKGNSSAHFALPLAQKNGRPSVKYRQPSVMVAENRYPAVLVYFVNNASSTATLALNDSTVPVPNSSSS